MGSNFPGFMNFLILFLAFGLPMIGWIVGKAKEQRESKRIKDEMRKRQEEQLRTGRTANADQPAAATATPTQSQQSQPTPASAERQRLQDLAAKRQAQLRELRARQRAAQQQPAQPQQTPTRRQSPTATVLRGPGPTAPSQQSPKPTQISQQRTPVSVPRQRQPQSQQRPSQRPAAQPQSTIRTPAELPAAISQPQVKTRRATKPEPFAPAHIPVAASGDIARDVRSLLGVGARGNKQQRAARLRSLLAVKEILREPVSLREHEQL